MIQAINFLPGHFYFCYIVTRNINSLIFILTFFRNFLLLRARYRCFFYIRLFLLKTSVLHVQCYVQWFRKSNLKWNRGACGSSWMFHILLFIVFIEPTQCNWRPCFLSELNQFLTKSTNISCLNSKSLANNLYNIFGLHYINIGGNTEFACL